MNWLHYLVEANLYMAAFYMLYVVFLRSETLYQLNRAYLLGTSALAFIIPFIQLGVLKPVVETVGQISVGGLHNGGYSVVIDAPLPPEAPAWSFNDYLLLGYGIVAAALLIHLMIRVYLLMALFKKGSVTKDTGYNLVELHQGSVAFSFFNNLFIDDRLASSQTVLYHEQVHIRQKHSWDIIYLEFVKIISWFNPVVYLLIASVKEVHEFIADAETAKLEKDNDTYTDFLISNAYGITQNSLTNSFFNKNLLKRRITMLYQKKSGNGARLKYLLALPLTAGLLCASTMAFTTKTYGLVDLAPVKTAVVKLSAKATNSIAEVPRPVIKGIPLIIEYDKITSVKIPAHFDFNNVDKANYGHLIRRDARDIISIELLTPETAKAKYGEKGANGAVVLVVKFPPPIVIQEPIVTAVDVQPDFPGGEQAFVNFLQKNIHYPQVDKAKGIQGKVYVQFVVSHTGVLYNFKILRTPSPAMEAEALRVLKLSPNWKPGSVKGKKVNVEFTLPINFALPPPPPPVAPGAPVQGGKPAEEPNQIIAVRDIGKTVANTPDNNAVYTAVQKTPEFPGGEKAESQFIQKNIRYPAKDKVNNVYGRVYIQFIVEKDGTLTDMKVLRSPSDAMAEEAIRVLKLSPKWVPGLQDGLLARVMFTQPINFSLGDN